MLEYEWPPFNLRTAAIYLSQETSYFTGFGMVLCDWEIGSVFKKRYTGLRLTSNGGHSYSTAASLLAANLGFRMAERVLHHSLLQRYNASCADSRTLEFMQRKLFILLLGKDEADTPTP